MQNNETNGFKFTYSAKEQQEIKAIRDKYASPTKEENTMEKLRRLDEGVTQKASAVSLVFGVIGALILGSGMSLAMTDIGTVLNLNSGLSMLIGIIIGVLGIVLVSLAYPLYNSIVKAERKKIAPEIIRLTDELLK